MLFEKVDAENEQKHTQLKEALQKIEARRLQKCCFCLNSKI